MNYSELKELVGKEGALETEGFNVHVFINDAKRSYGNLRLMVTPLSGSGSAWVSAERVKLGAN